LNIPSGALVGPLPYQCNVGGRPQISSGRPVTTFVPPLSTARTLPVSAVVSFGSGQFASSSPLMRQIAITGDLSAQSKDFARTVPYLFLTDPKTLEQAAHLLRKYKLQTGTICPLRKELCLERELR
jgi:hypothetical protein